MIEMKTDNRFDAALKVLPWQMARTLEKIPEAAKNQTREIRLRAGGPLMLTVREKSLFVGSDAALYDCPVYNAVYAERADLEETFKFLCRGSVYAHMEELKEGFIRMSYGNRAGVCGRIMGENLSEITSGNIRIARQIFGAADDIVGAFDGGGVLICGAPAVGKTTVLRDLIRQLSNGQAGRLYRVSVIDSRGELAAAGERGNENDLGAASDVLLTSDKAKGIEIAIRTLNPEIIAFDEISTTDELKSISEGFYAGVSFITTAHAGSIAELGKRPVTRQLLETGAIKTVAFLRAVGEKPQILRADELCRF